MKEVHAGSDRMEGEREGTNEIGEEEGEEQ